MSISIQDFCPHHLFNPIYEQVRKLGLYYEIKETEGSTNIRISTERKTRFRKEKFRFLTTRTLNGSDSANWRKPENYEESRVNKNSTYNYKFPDLQFFCDTPPPALPTPPAGLGPTSPTPPSPVSGSSPARALSLSAPTTAHLVPKASTPSQPPQCLKPPLVNPYRQIKRSYQSIPAVPTSILSPSSPPSFETSTPVTTSAPTPQFFPAMPPDKSQILDLTTEDVEALKKLVAVYMRK